MFRCITVRGDIFLLVELAAAPRTDCSGARKYRQISGTSVICRDLAYRDRLGLHDLKPLPQLRLTHPAGGIVLKKDMERVKVPVFRVNAIGRKAAAQIRLNGHAWEPCSS